MKPAKATHEQLKRHNRQMLLRAIFSREVNNRAALAQVTGLAKPTVSDLIAELIDEGLLVEGGHGESTESGGKRPRLLEFVPTARQVIGISLEPNLASGVLSNLDGQIVARHYASLSGVQGEMAVMLLIEAINGLIAQLDAPLLCLGVGVPGIVEHETGIVRSATSLGWRNLALASMLGQRYEVPVYLGNNTELAAMSQLAFGSESGVRNLVTVLVNSAVEVGIALDGAAYHSGGDIGCLRVDGGAGDDGRLDSFLGWDYVQRRAGELRRIYPDTLLPASDLTYLHLRYAAAHDDPAALQIYEQLTDYLAQVFAWVIGLLRPDHLALAGPITDLGMPLLHLAGEKAERLLQPELIQAVTFSLAGSANLSAIGAVAQALQNELGILS